MTSSESYNEEISILRERLEERIAEGDPILKALKERGWGLLRSFSFWLDLLQIADTLYWEAIHSGIHPQAALDLYEKKKQELAEILKREVS